MGRTSIITGVCNGSPLLSPVVGLKMSCPSILTNHRNQSIFLCCDWSKATGITQAHALFGKTKKKLSHISFFQFSTFVCKRVELVTKSPVLFRANF